MNVLGLLHQFLRTTTELWLVTAFLSADFARAQQPAPKNWSFHVLRQQAADLAKAPYRKADDPPLPDFLAKLTYDDFQQIHFRSEATPWKADDLRFDLSLIHRGFIFKDPVRIQLLDGGHAAPLDFNPASFNYEKVRLPESVPKGIDFAGFKVLGQNAPSRKWNEVASFLGASYFRIVGTKQQYGASARALAVDTGEPAGEEFPRLTQFWIEKPAKLADHLLIYALLDSPTVAGACRFLLTPGEDTSCEVEIYLYPRNAKKKFGFAPLTSMFLMGENRTHYIPDFRPEVHDSDGLLIATKDGRWTWRALENPEKRHRITKYSPGPIAGFGLMQRDRDFKSYQDLVGRYDQRPSLWVDLLGGFADGEVELVEIPTPSEYNDNIVAYWVPKQPLHEGQETRIQYRLSAISSERPAGILRVTDTRIAPSQEKRPPRFFIDFAGAALASSGGESLVKPRATASRVQIKNLVAQANPVTGGWRVFFDLDGAPNEITDIQVALEADGRPVSETWVYAYQPL